MSTGTNESGFREEALDLLSKLESYLLELEKAPSNRELIDQVFRILHTIKGSGSMFGFDDVVAFVHEIETVYELIRSGRISVTSDLINRTLQARDQVRLLISQDTQSDSPNLSLIGHLITEFQTMASRASTPASPTPRVGNDKQASSTPSSKKQKKTKKADSPEDSNTSKSNEPPPPPPPEQMNDWRILFTPGPDFFRTGNNPTGLFNELATLGQTKVRALTEAIPPLETLNPESCFLSWEIDIRTAVDVNAIKDVFIFVEDSSKIEITPLEDPPTNDRAAPPSSAATLSNTLTDALNSDPAETVESDSSLQMKSELRISADKLDRIVELIGELVTVQARLSQLANKRNDSELISLAEEFDRLSGDLRDNALKACMVPINIIFGQLRQHLTEVAKSQGKEIEIELDGSNTELDKAVVDRLVTPLDLLLRLIATNSIERPEQRRASGKPSKARILISAHHFGGNFCIEVRDNGQGFSPEFISERAKAVGIVVDAAGLDSQELLRLLCHPGYLSEGGLDTAKAVVDELRGSIDIENHPGEGVVFTLRLPLTLSIIEGLVVALGSWLFVLPLAAVEECIELTRGDEDQNYRKNVIMVRERIVPYIPLREKLGIEGTPPAIQQIVIAGIGQYRVGFVVDQVIGESQTVIKPLGKMYKNVQGISGASILGDGTVALIIDLAKIVQEENLHDALQKGGS